MFVVRRKPGLEVRQDDWPILGCFILLDGLGILNYRMLSHLRVVFVFVFECFWGRSILRSILISILTASCMFWSDPHDGILTASCHGRPAMAGHCRPKIQKDAQGSISPLRVYMSRVSV